MAESLVNDRHYQWSFDGVDADERLNAALSSSPSDDVILPESST